MVVYKKLFYTTWAWKIGLIFSLVAMVRCADRPCLERIDYSNINVNKDVNLDSLFAPVDSIILKDTWQDISAISYEADSIQEEKSYIHAKNRLLKIIKMVKDGNKHYFAVFEPYNQDTISHAVLLFANGLDQKDPSVRLDKNFTLSKILDDLPNHYIVVPSYRGQALIVENKRYCSDGFFGDAFDGAAIDAARSLQYCINHFKDIDLKNINVYGISRGATVGLIMATRLAYLNRIIIQSGPYNFLDKSPYWLYGRQFKYQFLDKKETIYELRKKILRSSPLYFLDHMK